MLSNEQIIEAFCEGFCTESEDVSFEEGAIARLVCVTMYGGRTRVLVDRIQGEIVALNCLETVDKALRKAKEETSEQPSLLQPEEDPKR